LKIVRYHDIQGEKYGALINKDVVDLVVLAERFNVKFPKRLDEFITMGMKGLKKAEEVIKNVKSTDLKRVSTRVNEITLLAPISFPPKIVCLGLNYRDHAGELHVQIPDEPIFS